MKRIVLGKTWLITKLKEMDREGKLAPKILLDIDSYGTTANSADGFKFEGDTLIFYWNESSEYEKAELYLEFYEERYFRIKQAKAGGLNYSASKGFTSQIFIGKISKKNNVA